MQNLLLALLLTKSTIVCQDQDSKGSDEEDVHCRKPTARWPKIVRGKIQKNLNTWKCKLARKSGVMIMTNMCG